MIMQEELLLPRITELCQKLFDQMPEADTFTLDTSFVDDLGLESLDRIDLIMACETTFGIKVNMEEAKNLTTIRDLCKYIVQCKAE